MSKISNPKQFSLQKSVVYTTTTMNGSEQPETKIYRSGYAETNDGNVHKYYTLADDGEFKESNETSYQNVKNQQDNMIASSRLVDQTVGNHRKSLALPTTSPSLPLKEETELCKLRRENRELRQVLKREN